MSSSFDAKSIYLWSVDSPMEMLKLLGYVNAMIGYCQSLRVGTIITDGYMKRMDEHYIPNMQKAYLLIAELVDRAQAPKREFSSHDYLTAHYAGYQLGLSEVKDKK